MTPHAAVLDGQEVLAIFAHPDDESLACGGTLAMLAHAGARVVVMCASHGERGSINGPARDADLAHERAGEIRRAAEELGVAEVRLLSHPDGELRWADVSLFNAEILLFLRRRPVAAVITFGEDGLYWHPDHIGVHERVVTAVASLGAEAPPLYFVTFPRTMPDIVQAARDEGWTPPMKGFWSIPPESFGLAAEPHSVAIDVRSEVAHKISAILAHRSQMGANHPFARLTPLDAQRWLGTEYFRRARIPGRPGEPLELLCTSAS